MIRSRFLLLFLPLLTGLWACSPSSQSTAMPTAIPATQIPPPTATPLPPTESVTATPPACLNQPGRIEQGSLETTKPPQEYIIYLPPCYDERPEQRYPVLYLLHGQTYTDDQWVRLGAVQVADRLFISGEAQPFIIVFPDDRYWNLQSGPGFGDRLVEALIPYIDEQYRTIADRDNRAIGGLSRGAGWALRLGLQRWDLFGILGLHSLAVFSDDRPFLAELLEPIPPEYWPRISLDMGDNDQELGFNTQFEGLLTEMGIPHEWRLYAGAHDERYWSEHVEEYLRWYAQGWSLDAGTR
jgi:enterochelin esterase-like enzyme